MTLATRTVVGSILSPGGGSRAGAKLEWGFYGVHPTSAGNAVWADYVHDALFA